MKKMFMTLIIALTTIMGMQAMSNSSIRNHARFLSDRMAYELDLAPWQYEECYEINYDFIRAIDRIMDDVVFGYYDAVDRYYDYLDDRNDDMRYVLSNGQYRKFMGLQYFYRPVYTYGHKWNFRIYTIYSNHKFYYYDAPRGFKVYVGAHARTNHTSSYYATRKPGVQNHTIYMGSDHRIKGSNNHAGYGRNDFGANRVQRPADNKKPQRDNYYNNGNQKNRDKDNRYHDNSGNQHAPQINHPEQQKPQTKPNTGNQKPQGNSAPTSHRR